MAPNFIAILLCGLIPIVIGFIWYSPKTLGPAWQKAASVTDEQIQNSNMILILGLSYVLGVLLALGLYQSVIHQSAFYSILVDEPGFGTEGSEIMIFINDFMAKYGENYRTFKHGAFHGVLAGLLFATPVIAINALFERKSFKYIAIHAGYWILTIALIGGVISQWG